MKNINSKILMNKQIIEEIKRRKEEIAFIHKDQINNMKESVNKKGNASKAFQKKFNEVEIFIQRECKTTENVEKYGKWENFTMITFIKKNEDLLKRKYFYEKEIEEKNKMIDFIVKERGNFVEIKKEEKKIGEINDIETYFNNFFKLCEYENKFIKIRTEFLFELNIKKSVIPTFKYKKQNSNISINLNLLDPNIIDLELKLKKDEESEEIKLNDKEKINKINIELNKTEEKFEKEMMKDNIDSNTKGREIKPPENEDWGDL